MKSDSTKRIGIEDLKTLHTPSPTIHKGQNGKLLIIAGSEKYHGSLVFATKIASKIVGLVYISSVPENHILIQRMKSRVAEFITIPRTEVLSFLPQVDAILVGPGMEVTEETRHVVNTILRRYPRTPIVLDADALSVVDKRLLHSQCILTPHKGEFQRCFGLSPTRQHAIQMAKKFNCVVVLKGRTSIVASPTTDKINTTGNAGMAKGGTGDVLAGLIAALACTNDPFLAACAGTFLNGLAGDRLQEKYSFYYNASDLITEIPRAFAWVQRYSRR